MGEILAGLSMKVAQLTDLSIAVANAADPKTMADPVSRLEGVKSVRRS